MKYKIYYTSSRNVAETIAYTIGDVIGSAPERLNPAYMPDNVDLMFLGCDGSHPDEVILNFISALKPSRVKFAALFNTNSKLTLKGIERMRSLLQERGIQVLPDPLVCVSRPFQKDLEGFDRAAVLDFANESVRNLRRLDK